MSEPIRAVFDCMVFVQAAIRPQPVHATMRLVFDRKITLIASAAVIDEVSDVLSRPEMTAKFPALTADRVGIFLTTVFSYARILRDVPNRFLLPRDKKDEPYLDLAIAAEPCHLVTWNDRHLTYLMRQDTPGAAFCVQYPGVQIMDPPTFLQYVRQAR